MFSVIIAEKGGEERRQSFEQSEVTIGRVQGNDIILPKGNVSKRHSRIVFKDGRFVVVDLKSTNGTYVNGRKISSPLVVKAGDKIYIGDFTLTVEESTGEGRADHSEVSGGSQPRAGRSASAAQPSSQPSSYGSDDDASEPAPPPSMQLAGPATLQPVTPHAPARPITAPIVSPLTPGKPIAAVPTPGRPLSPQQPISAPGTGPNMRGLTPAGVPAFAAAPRAGTGRTRALETEMGDAGTNDPLEILMTRLARSFEVFDTSLEAMQDPARWAAAERAIDRTLRELVAEGALDEGVEHTSVPAAALREAVGLGIIESLLADERVREIAVSGPSHVLADRGAGLEPVEGGFSSTPVLLVVITRLFAQTDSPLDGERPVIEATLPYGAHVKAILPPVTIGGPVLEIRRPPRATSMQTLVAEGVLSFEMSQAIERALGAKKNVLVIGLSGSGVTSLLSAAAALFPKRERLIVVEAVPDLVLERPGTVTLCARSTPSAPSLRQLVVHASHLRSDRLLVDDVGADELFTVLTQLSRHKGGHLVGVHASSGGEPLEALRALARHEGKGADVADTLIGRTVHLIVEIATTREGRHVTRLVEVSTGPEGEPRAKSLFVWDQGFRATT